ncbi:hypothetical protein OIU84_000943 [Salix udensis]|uniref:CTLH domain-containing protein n=1 Tax=Salix udensis TaxID=889485 RepID=A0AAD6L5X6_9ROSI|nr:hypothetical protein OIU84_000943 [Salix udensis]
MSLLWSELVFLILQFLGEEKFKETVHRLEQESGLYFNTRNFEEMVTNGEWDELEKYLSGLTKVDDNRYSMEIFLEIRRKQKYLAALAKYMESAQQFPSLKNSRLRTQINQRSSRISGLAAVLLRLLLFQLLLQDGWMANPSVVSRLSASAGPIYLVARNNAAAILKRRGGHPTKNTAIDYQTADSEHVSKRPRPFGPSDEVNNLPVNIMPISYSSQNHGQSS